MSAFGLYVPKSGAENLGIGMRDGVWGWKEDAVAKQVHALARRGIELIEALRPGDVLVFGFGGPSSRVAAGGWADATLGAVHVCAVAASSYRSSDPVWPDELYPHRVGLDEVERGRGVAGVLLGGEAMEALRQSANLYGLPIPIGAYRPLPLTTPTEGGEIDLAGPLDAMRHAAARREQAEHRRRLLGGRTSAPCALCGRVLPERHLRAAHIKQRARCSEREKRATHNVLLACVFGCDALFEHGDVVIADDGTIVANGRSQEEPAVAGAVAAIAGRRVDGFAAERLPFVQWHRTRHEVAS